MKKKLILTLLIALGGTLLYAQSGPAQQKKERKRNLVGKELNQKAGSTTQYLDNQKTYDHLGRKVEEVEYASYGQKSRTTYEYEGDSRLVKKEVEYNEKDKVARVKKFEYNPDGTKAKQYNYAPNGKLQSTKVFEYSYK